MVVQGHVSDQVALVSETSPTLRTLVGLLLGGMRDIGGVVIDVLVPLQQMFLSEALITLVTWEKFLVCLYKHVGLEVALEDGGVRT